MSKRKETLEIEEHLRYMVRKNGIYGCEEVTIGFAHNGHGNEIVDFCTMDSHGVIKCYEIKVTLSDLKSKAKKSWYGHYNYLVVTEELYDKICDDLEDYIPSYVGVAIPCEITPWSNGIEIVRAARRQQVPIEQDIMMKESLVRSMNYKIYKLWDACDLEKMSKLKSQLRKADKLNEKQNKELSDLRYVISKVERILRKCYDKDISLEEIVDSIDNRKRTFPKEIHLKLTDFGKKMNKIIKEEKDEGF